MEIKKNCSHFVKWNCFHYLFAKALYILNFPDLHCVLKERKKIIYMQKYHFKQSNIVSKIQNTYNKINKFPIIYVMQANNLDK